MEVRTVRSLNLLWPATVPTAGKHSPVELLAHWQSTQRTRRSAAFRGASSASHWAGTKEKRGGILTKGTPLSFPLEVVPPATKARQGPETIRGVW